MDWNNRLLLERVEKHLFNTLENLYKEFRETDFEPDEELCSILDDYTNLYDKVTRKIRTT